MEGKCVCKALFKAEIVIRMGSAVFTAALLTIALSWKISKCPSTDEWIKKLWYIYTCTTCMEYYSVFKGNKFKSVLVGQVILEPVI